jgi:PAS domain S-box-containing protein
MSKREGTISEDITEFSRIRVLFFEAGEEASQSVTAPLGTCESREKGPGWKRWLVPLAAGAFLGAVGFAKTCSRISERSLTNDSDSSFHTLAETASDAIITINEESRIVYVNASAEKVFGYAKQEMIGADLTMLMPANLRHHHRNGVSRYRQTGEKRLSWKAIELPGLHKSGREIPLEISFNEFTRGDKRFFTGIARDITERKRAEQERKQAEEALRRSREERFAELERVRRRIATDLHDDIGSSLTRISLLSEVVQRQINANKVPPTESLASIANLSRELVDSMSDIVWAINPNNDHLNDLTQRMRAFASDIFTSREIDFHFQAPGIEEDIEVGANFRRELFLLLKEAINNIVRHSECSHAYIEFRAEADRLFLKIRDNGRGFNVSRNGNGHGLASMRERTEALCGELEIRSRKGEGTTLIFAIPLVNQSVHSCEVNEEIREKYTKHHCMNMW